MTIEQQIRSLAKNYAGKLNSKIESRLEEMKEDDRSHFLVYQVLGITTKEGHMIDMYQKRTFCVQVCRFIFGRGH